jgi:uncharacterized protein YukE
MVMSEIKIHGVSKRQKRMLNIMWNLDSEEDYFEWYNSLDEELQKEAELLQRLIIMAELDNEVRDTSDAKELLKKFAL